MKELLRICLGLFVFLLAIPVFIVFAFGIFVLATGHVAAGVTLLAIGLIGLLIHAAISSALQTILLAALYQFASEHRAPDEFDRDTLVQAFRGHPA